MEKIILQSTKDTKKQRTLIYLVCIIFVVAVVLFVCTLAQYNDPSNWNSRKYYTDFHTGTSVWQIPVEDKWPNREFYMFPTLYISILCFIYSVKNLMFLISTAKNTLTITQATVRGISKSNKSIEIPIDKISSVSSVKATSGVIISTASGKQKFHWLENYEQICEELQNQMIERQNKASTPVQTTIKQEVAPSDADELKKFKELLDSGIISQEEFDAKKKQLLGL